jgi:hypothetical protein
MTAAGRGAVSSNRERGTPAVGRLPSESIMATPTIQTKDGKTVSVSVQPCQCEWRSCAYASRSLPLLFTTIVNAITTPRNASSETRRCVVGIASFAGVGLSNGVASCGANLAGDRCMNRRIFLTAGKRNRLGPMTIFACAGSRLLAVLAAPFDAPKREKVPKHLWRNCSQFESYRGHRVAAGPKVFAGFRKSERWQSRSCLSGI